MLLFETSMLTDIPLTDIPQLGAIYVNIDADYVAIAPIAPYRMSRFYRPGQSIVIDHNGYTVIQSFVLRDTYYVFCTRKMNGQWASLLNTGEVAAT